LDNDFWSDTGSGECSVADCGIDSAIPVVCVVIASAVMDALNVKCNSKGEFGKE